MTVKKLLGLVWSLPVVLFVSEPAVATWSIVAVDAETREVGLAAATCNIGVGFIAEIVPGAGVVAAQAATSFKGRNQARELIAEGRTADEILTFVSDPAFYDGRFNAKFPDLQYGIATLTPEPSAGFVGGDNLISWSGGKAGDVYSVQGNTLRSKSVVNQTAAAFAVATDQACQLSLAERLLRALEAGREAGGDKRCPTSRPAQSAILLIARPDNDANGIDRIVTPKDIGLLEAAWRIVVPYNPGPDEKEPIALLREKYSEAGGLSCR